MKRVFIIEDNKEYANYLRLALRSEFKIHLFHTAEDSLKAVNATVPDVFVVDFYLPGMNGLELYEELKKLGIDQSAKIILLSGVEDGKLVLEFIKKGVREYVIKDEKVIDSLKAVMNDDDEGYFDITFQS